MIYFFVSLPLLSIRSPITCSKKDGETEQKLQLVFIFSVYLLFRNIFFFRLFFFEGHGCFTSMNWFKVWIIKRFWKKKEMFRNCIISMCICRWNNYCILECFLLKTVLPPISGIRKKKTPKKTKHFSMHSIYLSTPALQPLSNYNERNRFLCD